MGALPPVVVCALGLLVMLACAPARTAPSATPTPTPVSAPIPVPEKPVPVDPLAEPWLVGSLKAPFTHQIEIATAVRAAASAAALAVARVDSLQTAVAVRWSADTDVGRRSGEVLVFQPPAGISLPISIGAALDADRGVVQVTTPREASCAAETAIAQLVREVLIAPPRRLARGVSWADSTRTTICRDSIPLTLASTRRYVVEDARVQEGRAVVVIRRRSTVVMSGSGMQFGEPVTITGEGQGELLFGLRLDDGQMTDGNGVSSLTLTLTGRRKSQVVMQSARLEIRRAP
jgi:hypothetical protein